MKITDEANETKKTVEPVKAGDFANVMPEFGRMADVQRIFGLKRGTIYNLLKAGKIRGVVLRATGQKSGCRLLDMSSIRDYLRQCEEAA